MKIGIDVSQAAYAGTGVGNYVQQLIQHLANIDKENDYVLFFSSLRRDFAFSSSNSKVSLKKFKFPPTILDFLWNKLHIFPIEWLIGDIDIFVSSDWTQPPTRKAKKVTVLYDLIIYKYPKETAEKIVAVQKRKLQWVKKECDMILCISEATKKDAIELLGIEEKRLQVVYPGI
ncbi:MAG TPA: glycosyltransferase [Candidatus Saccharimonadales bacterium]|nr:glycosyltransferase [Candidatus Saccharimonadales bacterium]